MMILAAATALAACTQKNSGVDLTKVNSFKVEITSGQTGTEASPLAFTSSGMTFGVRVTALDGFAQPVIDYAGPVQISSEPGNTFAQNPLSFSSGVGLGTITMKKAFGVTRVWVEDPKTFATGVTDGIYIRGPKISDLQISPNTISSPFAGERVIVDDQSNLVVSALARDGFYITDTNVAGGAWASIYAFTFSAPHGLQPGDHITNLSGTVSEFLGFTELNNPAYTTTGTTLPIPANKVLTCTEINQAAPNLTMESYEASLIEVDGAAVQVCATFPDCPVYDQYKQWTLQVTPGNCPINVVSNYTIANFDPRQNAGKTFTKLKGTLRHVQFASPQWILEPHSPADACCPTCSPALTQGC